MGPETKTSLIRRLGDPGDQDAWREFEAVYRPVVYYLARHKGLQDADAEDIVQQVLISVSRALQRRSHDPQRARFRTWLCRVTHNSVTNAIQRKHPDRGVGGTTALQRLARRPLPDREAELLNEEYEKSVFRWAATSVQPEFHRDTWNAFWMTMVQGKSCEAAAAELGKGIGSIYAARSRIVRRLREKIQEFDGSSQIP